MLNPRVSGLSQTIETEFGLPIEQLFESFDESPVASASIAQVHRAVLNGMSKPIISLRLPRSLLKTSTKGQEVAVKVQKSAIRKQVRPPAKHNLNLI